MDVCSWKSEGPVQSIGNVKATRDELTSNGLQD